MGLLVHLESLAKVQGILTHTFLNKIWLTQILMEFIILTKHLEGLANFLAKILVPVRY